MAILQCYVDDDTMARLQKCARDLARTVEDLAESAIAEAAIQAAPNISEKRKAA